MFKIRILPILSLALVAVLVLGACASTETSPQLQGVTWKWVRLTDPLEQTDVPNPESYTITFNADGSLNIKADCNSVFGSYELDDSRLKINLGGTTLMYCGDESLDTLFKETLSEVAIYSFLDDTLLLELPYDSGTMEFVQ